MTNAAAPLLGSAHEERIVEAGVLIDGERVRVTSSQPVMNPARLTEQVGRIADGTAELVDAAVASATVAGRAWARRDPVERAAMMSAAADAIEARVDELGLLLTREQGKTLIESRYDVKGSAVSLRYYAGLAAGLGREETLRDDERSTILIGKRAMGVTGVIVPWNSPVHLAFLGIAPALAAGNAVVVKPSSFAALALSEVVGIVASVLPPGVIGFVPGPNAVGAALVEHPGVRKIFFTGSTKTGKAITAASAGNLKRLSLELGGNDPAIVLDSATIDGRLITELARGAFSITGQVCFGIKRIFAHRSNYDAVVAGLVARIDSIVIGDGRAPGVTMGPVNNAPQFARVRDLVGSARASGATVSEGGIVDDPDAWDNGYFLRPSIVTRLDRNHPLSLEEQFGPSLPVLPFDDEEDAIELANAGEFGLSASVWTDDIDHARSVARQIEAGSVYINAHRAGVSDVATPFGGVKQSGIGRSHGPWALEACLETQVIADFRDLTGFPPPAIG
ncbi:MAG TPA: aldehyde dehydrogenase family protein [Galbitalea sp.]|jgi:aldehyde dehydrogenase